MRRTLWTIVLAATLGVACQGDRQKAEHEARSTAEKTERQPVVGRLPFVLYMIDADGKEWLIQDHKLIEDVQRKLDAKGFEVTTDGKPDVETTVAVRRFQQKHELDQSGKIDRATARALGLDWHRFLAEKGKRKH